MTVLSEIDENFGVFQSRWWEEISTANQANSANQKLKEAYRALAAINAVRINVSDGVGDAEFFLEAQNDGLASLVLCQIGMFRASLQSLRSFIESGLNGLYYKDHPVELARWKAGSFKTAFSDLTRYFDAHPGVTMLAKKANPVAVLTGEYAVLSKAVHGSAKAMWMSGNGQVFLAGEDAARIGAWNTRFNKVSRAMILLMVAVYQEKLSGAQQIPSRMTIGLVLSAAQRLAVKEQLKITFPMT